MNRANVLSIIEARRKISPVMKILSILFLGFKIKDKLIITPMYTI